MPFDKETKEEAFVRCNRHCCICGCFCGIKIEAHHIKQEAKGGPNTLENCIPLCLNCHAEVQAYNPMHPKGNKYTENELKRLRDKTFEKYSVELNSYIELIKTNISLKIDTAVEEILKKIEKLSEKKSSGEDYDRIFSYAGVNDFFENKDSCEDIDEIKYCKRNKISDKTKNPAEKTDEDKNEINSFVYNSFYSEKSKKSSTKITVVGVGGAGNNAINRMVDAGFNDAELIAVNTDKEILKLNKAPIRLLIGEKLTKGMGSGANPQVGRKSAEESQSEIYEILKDTDIVFITAGMGGGTGTGAAPVIAKIAKEMGILTVAVVTKPFTFEGQGRSENAEAGLIELKKYVDSIIIVPNDKLLQIVPKGTPVHEAFKYADDILRQSIQAISELLNSSAMINLDFADVCNVLKDKGIAYIAIGHGKGNNRALNAVRQAASSPMIDKSIIGARSVLINITGGPDVSINEIFEIVEIIKEVVHTDANIVFGADVRDYMNGEIIVTIIAAGFE